MSYCAIHSQYIMQLRYPGVWATQRIENRRSKIQGLHFPQSLPTLESLLSQQRLHFLHSLSHLQSLTSLGC